MSSSKTSYEKEEENDIKPKGTPKTFMLLGG
jgi:hypothetical protein